jgi:Xaa-Pro dipeptidase
MSVSLPTPPSRRSLLLGAPAGLMAVSMAAGPAAPARAADRASDLTGSAAPITADERVARVAKLQGLLQAAGVAALLVEAGTTLDYFTGVQWWRSERTTAALIPARGEVLIVTPAFEEPSVRETLAVPAEVRVWNEHESPFQRLAQGLADLGVTGPVAVEATTRWFIVDGIARASGRAVVPGDPMVRACRLIKSPAELALLSVANRVTLEAIRKTSAEVRTGMTQHDIAALIDRFTGELGGKSDGALVLLNEASAYPHGSIKPQTVAEGSVVLIDCGCRVQGYVSDISRTFIHGEPTPRQRQVWDTVRRGQDVALDAARLGSPVGRVDDAVRAFYEKSGWGPGYHLPGLPHRTGHGIGLDGHEAPYLVHGDETPLAPGMCFSDEPGLYIPGAFGIRLEDCWRMTQTGPVPFTPLARSIDDPI